MIKAGKLYYLLNSYCFIFVKEKLYDCIIFNNQERSIRSKGVLELV